MDLKLLDHRATARIKTDYHNDSGETYASFDDVDGPVVVGDLVNAVIEKEKLTIPAWVVQVDGEERLVWLLPKWGQPDRGTRVLVNPEVRGWNNNTTAGFEDVDGPIDVYDRVTAVSRETGKTARAYVTGKDRYREIVRLSVEWDEFL